MFTVDFYDSEGRLDHNATVASLEELNELAKGRSIKFTGEVKLAHDEAMQVIDAYREFHDLPGTLEALQSMKRRDWEGALTHRQKHAFEVIFKGFQRLFHGDEA